MKVLDLNRMCAEVDIGVDRSLVVGLWVLYFISGAWPRLSELLNTWNSVEVKACLYEAFL